MKTLPILTLCFLGACSSNSNESAQNDSGAGGQLDGGATEDPHTSDEDVGGTDCREAKEQLLTPIASTSTGDVTVLGDIPGGKLVYIDASAGGTQASVMNPRIYIALSTLTRVDVTDVSAASSVGWDLAIKRPILFANDAQGGPGQGGSAFIADKDFDTVTIDDAKAATFLTEQFVDRDCAPQLDAAGSVKTSFDGWYDYDLATNLLAPREGTWIVRGATGSSYKVKILSYYATPDGGVGQSGGRYTLKIGAL